jgi:hypothetical protein
MGERSMIVPEGITVLWEAVEVKGLCTIITYASIVLVNNAICDFWMGVGNVSFKGCGEVGGKPWCG